MSQILKSQTVKQTSHLLHTQIQTKHTHTEPHTHTHTHTHIPNTSSHLPTYIQLHSLCDLHSSPCNHKNPLALSFKHTDTLACTHTIEVHECMTKCKCAICTVCTRIWVCVCVCVWEGSVCQRDVCGGPSGHPRHATAPVKCCQRGPLWSPVATGGSLRSTSSPGSRPQKRKFGSLKWRGCSRAICMALHRSSATHDIPYENQCVCVCGACGVVCVCVGV